MLDELTLQLNSRIETTIREHILARKEAKRKLKEERRLKAIQVLSLDEDENPDEEEYREVSQKVLALRYAITTKQLPIALKLIEDSTIEELQEEDCFRYPAMQFAIRYGNAKHVNAIRCRIKQLLEHRLYA